MGHSDGPTVASLQALVDELAADNARLRDQLDEQREAGEATADATTWVPLKAAIPPGTISYETGRVWAAQGHVRSRRIGGRLFVDRDSLATAIAMRLPPSRGVRCA